MKDDHTPSTRPDLEHALGIRAILKQTKPLGWGWCGCQRPNQHEDGCLWGLDDDHRRARAEALAAHPLPVPRLSPEDLAAMIARLHLDPQYAEAVAARFRDMLGES